MRPVDVTLAAYFQFVRSALLAILALGIRCVGGMASRLASLASEGNAVQQSLCSLGHFLFMALLIYALILVILGFGLLMGQHWARSLTVVLSGLGFLVLLPRLIRPHPLSVLFGALNSVV